jgi:hypothetical protein
MFTDEYMGRICNTLIHRHLFDPRPLPEGVFGGGGGGVFNFRPPKCPFFRTLVHESVCAKCW